MTFLKSRSSSFIPFSIVFVLIIVLVGAFVSYLGFTLWYKQDSVTDDYLSNGRLITQVTVHASDEDTYYQAENLTKQSGFIGTPGKQQKHLAQSQTMWRASAIKGKEVALEFGFEAILPLSEIWIWNYNEIDHDNLNQTQRGLKNIRIYLSTDGETWTEWTGDGYPFQLAKATGSKRQGATNLNNEHHTPIQLPAVPTKAVKIVADATAGNGNWGGADGQEATFGLSKVLFYSYTEKVQTGAMIYPLQVASSIQSLTSPIMLINNLGMNGIHASTDFHDADANGKSMWLAQVDQSTEADTLELLFDLGGTYPISDMHIWNYNQSNPDETSHQFTEWGLKDIQVFYSLTPEDWIELKSEGYPYRLAQANGKADLQATNLDDKNHSPIRFHNASARFVKITVNLNDENSNWAKTIAEHQKYGLSEVRFFIGEGLVAEPAADWDMLFSRYFEWTGADGIFSIPLNGYDQPFSESDSSSNSSNNPVSNKTWFLFSDTFIGLVDSASNQRKDAVLTNNTGALLIGRSPDPSNIEFRYGTNGLGIDTKAIFVPNLEQVKPGFVQPDIPINYWYWLQDGIVIDHQLYIFPLLMKSDPNSQSVFNFQIDGVALLQIPLDDQNEPLLDQVEQRATPLYYRVPDTKISYTFGAGILANTTSAGASQADGYFYVFGYRDELPKRSLIVARIKETDFTQFNQWTYWDGTSWSANIEDSKELADHVSPELSVTPWIEKDGSVRYLLIYQKDTLGSLTAYRWADYPWGPYHDEQLIYVNTDSKLGSGVYSYNAKAHPHLSSNHELLVSYNVNSLNWKTNIEHADVYRPRWFRITLVESP